MVDTGGGTPETLWAARAAVLRGGLDPTDPVAGCVVLFVLDAVAEAKRTLSIERTRASLAAVPAAGRPVLMSPDKLEVARRLVGDGSTIAAAPASPGVSRSTLSRHR